jgi:SAM-dependent methyltransferase
MTRADLMRVRPDDHEYRALAAAEAAYWNAQHPAGMEVWEETVGDGPADLHTNERFTDDRHTRWYETIQHYGRFQRCLILGTSGLRSEATILRLNPEMHVTFVDISDGALERRTQRFEAEFPGRVQTMVADFNFVELTPRSYDVIISSSSIHHVTNLEYLADQVKEALTDNGLFFLNDYVGEPRFNACDAKRRVFQLISDRDYRRHGLQPQPVHWLDASDLSPFCGVRSDEIPDVFARHLAPERIRTAGALTVPLLRTVRTGATPGAPAWSKALGLARKVAARVRNKPTFQRHWIDHRLYDELTFVGEMLADAGVFPPGNIFGVYGRR